MSERIHSPESIIEREPNPEEIGALIVLGKNKGMFTGDAKRFGKTNDVLSMESKMAAVAAGWLYLNSKGQMKEIIFSGGKTSGQELNSEAQSMANYLRRIYPQIPETALALEENSLDTASNSKDLQKLLEPVIKESPTKKVGLLTTSAHKNRASEHMHETGLEFDNFEIEKILAQISGHHQNFLKQRANSPFTGLDDIKEEVLTFLNNSAVGKKFISTLAKRRSK